MANKPPLPPQQESRKPKASEYYKNYVKSIYEREPLFNDFCNNLPAERRNFYNRDNLTQVKQARRDQISYKFHQKIEVNLAEFVQKLATLEAGVRQRDGRQVEPEGLQRPLGRVTRLSLIW